MITDDIKIEEGIDLDGRPQITIHSKKYKNPVIISKQEGGFCFYQVSIPPSIKVPNELSGSYSRLDVAVDAVLRYIHTARYTPAAKTKYFSDNREKRKEEVKNASRAKSTDG